MDVLQEFRSDDLYMRYAVDEAPDDKNYFMHVHEQCEIFYFVSGHAEYLVEGTKYPLKSGSILIMRPSESHRAKILDARKYERYAVNFSVSVTDHIDPQHRFMKAFFDRPLGRGNLYLPSEFNNENIRKIFDEMRGGTDDYERQLKILSHLFLLLNMIDNAFTKRGSADYAPPQSIAEEIVSYVNTHLFEELSVSMLADYFFLSTSQFGRIFKQATGAAPWEYITIKRLTMAREKIRSGISAQNAGEICGFGDYSAFYRSYVKYFGHSPQKDIL